MELAELADVLPVDDFGSNWGELGLESARGSAEPPERCGIIATSGPAGLGLPPSEWNRVSKTVTPGEHLNVCSQRCLRAVP